MKKIILLTMMLFCDNATATTLELQPNKKNTTIYLKLMDIYIKRPIGEHRYLNISLEEANQFLIENNVSPQQLYDILKERYEFIKYESKKLLNSMFIPSPIAANTMEGVGIALGILGSYTLGIPTLGLGLAINQYKNPSTIIEKIGTYGLLALGITASMPAILYELYTKGAMTQYIFELIREKITHKKSNMQELYSKLNQEISDLKSAASMLTLLYPAELQSRQNPWQW